MGVCTLATGFSICLYSQYLRKYYMDLSDFYMGMASPKKDNTLDKKNPEVSMIPFHSTFNDLCFLVYSTLQVMSRFFYVPKE